MIEKHGTHVLHERSFDFVGVKADDVNESSFDEAYQMLVFVVWSVEQ